MTRSFVTIATLCLAGIAPAQLDLSSIQAKEWRLVGPFRGGRSAACCGIDGDRNTYYFGAAGGGVWKTQNAGVTWKNVSDGFFGGSIGAVAVAASDANVIYVGGGEKTVRGNVSHGGGIWKSTDAGKTWKHVGLRDSRRVPRIRIHPQNPDVAYAAVLGHLFGANEQRGVYRTRDGGRTWERILFANEHAGAVDLCMDPSNPRILFASTWRVKRTPYSLESGGEGSALWKSTDGGDTWKEITRNKGLPKGMVGIIGVAVSPVNPERVFAIVEAKDGGVFRSQDGGDTWSKINSERKLRQRAWYYTRIYADPKDADVCYVLNVRFWKSKDGGKTFSSISVPHGDNHDLWIAANDPKRMIESNDGGANVSFDGGRTWSRQDNQPTAQFYRVTTDNHVPYRIYGAQQDNSTVRILHRGRSGIGMRDWEPTAGGESGHIAPHPKDPDIVFGGSYGGHLSRINHRTGERRLVNVWPDNPMGWGAGDLKYRFQWNFPIFFSPHEPHPLFCAGNVLFRSTDGGGSWQPISGDLTRNDNATLGASGGPITKDNTGVEYYATIFAACESPHEPGVFWCGSDDGLLHISRDNGKSWKNVTPKGMPKWMQINSIDPHPFEKGGLYVAGTMYKSDDFRPYLYRTVDYGETWTKITKGIADDHFTRVVRADPQRRGLLFAGTERGVYLSFDDGANWQTFQGNLPIVPITDLCIKDGDLIAATQGRSFWVYDDLTPLQQLTDKVVASKVHLFKPRPTVLMGGGRGRRGGSRGQNPRSGVVLCYHLAEEAKDGVTIEILDAEDKLIRKYSTKAKKRGEKLTAKKGSNLFEWNMRYPDATTVPKMVLWGGSTRGPRAVPGAYRARLSAAGKSMTVPFEIRKDPRSSATVADLRAQFAFLMQVRDKLSETHQGILDIRNVRSQVESIVKRSKGGDAGKALADASKSLVEKLTSIEQALYQTKNQSAQDPLNFPIRLNNKLAAVAGTVSVGNNAPTKQCEAVRAELTKAIDGELQKLDEVMQNELPRFNELVKSKGVPAVILRSGAKPASNGK